MEIRLATFSRLWSSLRVSGEILKAHVDHASQFVQRGLWRLGQTFLLLLGHGNGPGMLLERFSSQTVDSGPESDNF